MFLWGKISYIYIYIWNDSKSYKWVKISEVNQSLRHISGFITIYMTIGSYSEAKPLENLKLEEKKIFIETGT